MMIKAADKTRSRLLYAAAFLLLVVVEVLIALYVDDAFIRPYGGDIIVIGVLYCFVRIIFPEKIRLLPIWLFLFACCVEAAQAVDYVSLLGLGDIPFFNILLGASFSWIDILCYAAGSIVCFLFQIIKRLLHC